jgi:glycosyltransferase involved in cell wall biosynthesis
VQVTHDEMEDLVLSAGVERDRVHRIPIAIAADAFPLGDDERREAARAVLGLPQHAFVVGSFQKDGVGFGEGLEPKLVKGPDVLVETLRLVDGQVDDLVVFLTGHARGYVRRELERHGIRHVHRFLHGRDDVVRAYHALDAYIVASRQEGGPKSILESMATGIAFVTTRCGQAPDLVVDGVNGTLADVEDAEGLAAGILAVHDDPAGAAARRDAGRRTAEENSHERLAPLWEALLDGFAERDG